MASAVLLTVYFFNKKENQETGMKGSQIVVAWDNAPRTVDPRYTRDANSIYLENLIHCSLIGFDESGKGVGHLASSWNWVNDKKFRITIKKGIKFSDGTIINAKDVLGTYQYFLTENPGYIPSPKKGSFKNVESIVLEDKFTLIFNLKVPDAAFINNLVVGILPENLSSQNKISDDKNLVGCGPFTIDKQSVTELSLVKNRHFNLFSEGPKVDRLVIKFVKDDSTLYSKLLKGEVDLVQNLLGRDKLEKIKNEYKDFAVQTKAGLNITYLGMNMKDPLLKRVEIRRAISLAINRDEIIKFLLNGLALKAKTILSPTDHYFNKNLPAVTYDPNKAKEILDQLGLKDPDGDGPKPRFALSYKTTTNALRQSIALAIGQQLKKIGIQLNVEALEWGKFKSDIEKGRVQLWSLSWIGFKDPDIYWYVFASENFPPNGGNRGWYSNPKLDKLLKMARETVDEKKRKQLYWQVQEILASDLPYVFLWHEKLFAVVHKKIKNFKIYADGRFESLIWAQKESK